MASESFVPATNLYVGILAAAHERRTNGPDRLKAQLLRIERRQLVTSHHVPRIA